MLGCPAPTETRAVQTLRSNALRMPQHTDTVLHLALAESNADNHSEAISLARHALHLNIASETAACTAATVMARAGLLRLARAALHLLPEPAAHQEALKALWPLGIPPHASVTQPAQPFFDPDIAEAALEGHTSSAGAQPRQQRAWPIALSTTALTSVRSMQSSRTAALSRWATIWTTPRSLRPCCTRRGRAAARCTASSSPRCARRGRARSRR